MDAYQTLEITPKASKAEIKRAYRRLANRYHPDRNDEAETTEKFKLVKEAYEFLTKGCSSTGKFRRESVLSTPAPTAAPVDVPFYKSFYKFSAPPHIIIPIPIKLSFTGGNVGVPKSTYHVWVDPGIEHDSVHRLTAISRDGNNSTQIDAQFQLFDPTRFYDVKPVDGALRLCCKVRVSLGTVLAELPVEIPNADPRVGSIFINFPTYDTPSRELLLDYEEFVLNRDRWYKIPKAGLLHRGRRGVLYVEPELVILPLSREKPHVLRQLKERINRLD